MFLRKGISIPINTLVMLAIAIIVLLATVAWFMGAFAPTATQQKLQGDFRNSCSFWVNSNCEKDTSLYGSDGVPDRICGYYKRMYYSNPKLPTTDTNCNHPEVALACRCNPPFGMGGATTTIATTTTTVCVEDGEPCDPNAKPDPCCGDCVEETAGSGIYICVT